MCFFEGTFREKFPQTLFYEKLFKKSFSRSSKTFLEFYLCAMCFRSFLRKQPSPKSGPNLGRKYSRLGRKPCLLPRLLIFSLVTLASSATGGARAPSPTAGRFVFYLPHHGYAQVQSDHFPPHGKPITKRLSQTSVPRIEEVKEGEGCAESMRGRRDSSPSLSLRHSLVPFCC